MPTPLTPSPASTADKPPPRRRWIPLSLRMFVVINAVVALVGIAGFWCVVVRPIEIHRRAYHRLSDSVQSLAHRRPADVSRGQWSFIIGWTMNGIANCCSIEQYLNRDEESHQRFLTLPDRFEERLRGEVTLKTVDWLWDELEVISKYGKRYSANWRPTTAERLAEGDRARVGSIGPIVD